MKNIYKIMMLGLLFLISNQTFAQLVQYDDDGKELSLDPELKSNSERSCLCFLPFQFGIFNSQIQNLGGSLKDEWLYEQELLLAGDITGQDYFAMHQGIFGVPSDYNFGIIQKDYFKRVETDQLAKEQYPVVDDYLKDLFEYYPEVLNKTTFEHKVFDIRKRFGANSDVYGDLKFDGRHLSQYSDNEVTIKINTLLSVRNSQRSNFQRYDLPRSRLERYYKNGTMSNFLVNKYLDHYNNLDYEDAIRFMTRYMVWISSRENREIPYQPFGNPDNIFVLEDQDYIRRHSLNADGGFPMDGWSPREFTEISDEDALYSLALNNLGAQTRSFLSNNNLNFKNYLRLNNHTEGVLDRTRNTIEGYENNQPFTGSFDNFITNGSGTSTNLPTDLGVDLGYQFTFNNVGVDNGLRGYSNMLNTLFNLDDNHRELEGSLMSAFLNADGVNLHSLTNDQLAQIFDFSTIYPWGGLYESNFFLEYAHSGIKDILEQNGIDFFNMLDRPYVIQAALDLAQGGDSEPDCEKKTWYLDFDSDGYYSVIHESCNKPGDKWKLNLTEKDCDDDDILVTSNCNIQNNPCKNIKEKFVKNKKFRDKYDALNNPTNFNKRIETGFAEKNEGMLIDLGNNEQGTMVFTPNKTWRGASHVHNNNYTTVQSGKSFENQTVKIHSPTDINQFLALASLTRLTNEPIEDVYLDVLASTGNYTIKFNGTKEDLTNNIPSSIKPNSNDNTEKYLELVEEHNFDPEAILLNFLEVLNLDKFISLYKIEKDNNGEYTPKQVLKNENGTIEYKDC